MTTIVTRASNGAPLTNAQMDTNLTNLNNDKVETSVLPTLAPLASPTFTGLPKAPTPIPGQNDTQIATTAFVTTANNIKADKTYVDTQDATLQTNINTKVAKAGDTMTGQLNGITPTADANLTRKDYVDGQISTRAPLNGVGTSGTWPINITGTATDPTKLPLTGGGVSGLTTFYGSSGEINIQYDGIRNWKLYVEPNSAFLLVPAASDPGCGVYLAAVPGALWASVSDIRYKKQVSPLENCLPLIEAIEPITYLFTGEDDSNKHHAGFSAQNVQTVIPEAVSVAETATGKLGIDKAYLIPYLVQAIKELSAKVTTLEKQYAMPN